MTFVRDSRFGRKISRLGPGQIGLREHHLSDLCLYRGFEALDPGFTQVDGHHGFLAILNPGDSVATRVPKVTNINGAQCVSFAAGPSSKPHVPLPAAFRLEVGVSDHASTVTKEFGRVWRAQVSAPVRPQD